MMRSNTSLITTNINELNDPFLRGLHIGSKTKIQPYIVYHRHP